jgi:hypothetical protein
MNKVHIDTELSALWVESTELAALVYAVHDAMLYGQCAEKTYAPGLWMLGSVIEAHAKKLAELNRRIFKGQEVTT